MKITYQQVEQNISRIANRTEYTKDFLYELLAAYGRSSSAISQLRSGVINKAEEKDAVLQKDVVYFKVYPTNTELIGEIEEIETDPLAERYQPRYLIATDLITIAAKDIKKKTTLTIKIADIDQQIAFFYGWTGDEITDDKHEAVVDRRAADKMKELYSEIEKENLIKFAKEGNTFRHDLNVFFSRLLFCFFAEDTGLFKKKQFTDAIKTYTNIDGSDLNIFFTYLFKALDSETKSGFSTPFSEFPYVNGSIFETSRHSIVIPDFNAQARHLILECAKSNWGEINPDIFGTLFQSIVDEQKRDEGGMDYTSVPNILKVIEPLFLDELRDFFDKNYDDTNKLIKLLNRISKIKVFDPACGSGNFLIISYKKLRELEHAVIARLNELSSTHKYTQADITSLVKLENFYGIEIDDFAREIAVLSLYLAAHQMNIEFEEQFGKKISIIPLIDIPTIICGNAARLDWQKVCPNIEHTPTKAEQKAMFDLSNPEQQKFSVEEKNYDEIYLIGNPPYKGARKQTKEQKEDLKSLFEQKFSRYKDLDYISIWLYKGSEYISNTRAELGFVSTNSLTQGDQVGILWPYIFNYNVEIGFAWNSFKWKNSARDVAGVTVVIINLRNINGKKKILYIDGVAKSVSNINAYLIESDSNVIVKTTRKNLNNDLPEMPKGNMPYDGGNLILSEEEKNSLIKEYPESGRFIRKFVNAKSFINDLKQYCLWIGTIDLEEAIRIPPIKERIEAVRQMRLGSSDKAANKLACRPHEFRETNEPTNKSLLVPSTSSENREYVPMAYLNNETIASNASFVIYDAPLWLFALLESKMHMAWIRTVCGQLETRIRYSSTLGYNTFPVPILTDEQKEKLQQSARKILLTRENHSEKTLAQMYDPGEMPSDLREAHDENDHIVDQLYRQKGFVNDEERLAMLFNLYVQMTSKSSRS